MNAVWVVPLSILGAGAGSLVVWLMLDAIKQDVKEGRERIQKYIQDIYDSGYNDGVAEERAKHGEQTAEPTSN